MTVTADTKKLRKAMNFSCVRAQRPRQPHPPAPVSSLRGVLSAAEAGAGGRADESRDNVALNPQYAPPRRAGASPWRIARGWPPDRRGGNELHVDVVTTRRRGLSALHRRHRARHTAVHLRRKQIVDALSSRGVLNTRASSRLPGVHERETQSLLCYSNIHKLASHFGSQRSRYRAEH